MDLPTVEHALMFSRSYAAASPHLGKTAREHITGLCDLLEATQLRLLSATKLREPLEAIEHALRMGFSPAEVLDENSPIRDGIRSALLRPNAQAQPQNARSEAKGILSAGAPCWALL